VTTNTIENKGDKIKILKRAIRLQERLKALQRALLS
jgi:hypothetical protein